MAINMIRNVDEKDLDYVYKIERECFPKTQAATRQQLKDRIKAFGNHFYILECAGEIIGFINGMVTNESSISDEMYSNSSLHNEKGMWQTVFGLDIVKGFRRNGYASLLMKEMINKARKEKRQGIILTCKENLINFYENFGFVKKGISRSVHGGVVWYDMVLNFKEETL